ncbi:MAG: regulatory protein GemA [Pseudomonadota bacterium]
MAKEVPVIMARRREIHGACRQLGIDEDLRHELQVHATGKTSMRAMSVADLDKVIAALEARGYQRARRGRRPAAQRADQRKIYVLWRLLAEAGVVQPGQAALRAFIGNSTFTQKWGEAITAPDFLSVARAQDVIEALKAMGKRHGVDLGQ